MPLTVMGSQSHLVTSFYAKIIRKGYLKLILGIMCGGTAILSNDLCDWSLT